LSGKTGTGWRDDDLFGWFVGYVEKDAEVYFFVLNLDLDENMPPDAALNLRYDLTHAILVEMGILSD
jgi:beta-lactamase class D